MKDVLAIGELSKAEIIELLERARKIKESGFERSMVGKIMASCFFEPSTRTRFSFESAMKRLGGEVIGFADESNISTQKGESLGDAIRIIGGYSDVVVIRHPEVGSAHVAADSTKKPVINAGDGENEHPTQTLLDLFTIKECQGKLEGLNIILAGDLRHGRAAHSLALGLKAFSPRLFFVAPKTLQMPDAICETLKREGVLFSCHDTFSGVIERADILYMTRLQKERFSTLHTMPLQITCELLEKAQQHLKVLHPLPRVDEISREVDKSDHAYYFDQAENGLYIRAALLERVVRDHDH